MAKVWNYIYPADPTITYGTCSCIHENRVLVGGHKADDSDGGGYNQIRYSDVGKPNEGYTGVNYVNVGSGNEAIRHMFDIEGGLLVIKDNSIWLKRSIDKDGMTSSQFDPVKTGFSRIRTAALLDGQVFILTYDGLFLFSGELVNLSIPCFAEWQTPTDQWSLGYWRALKWVLCNNITTGITYIFDMLHNRWMVDVTSRKFFTIGNPSGKCIFSDATNQLKYINANSVKTGTTEVFYPFNSFGNAYSDKYMRKILLNYTIPTGGSITVYAYGRNSSADTPVALLGTTGFTITDNTIKTVNLPANTVWRELSIRITSTTGVVMKAPAVEYDDRRLGS
jgi:hypothetical protein